MHAAAQRGDSEVLAQVREAASGCELAAGAAAADAVSVIPSGGGAAVPVARALAIAACAGTTSSAIVTCRADILVDIAVFFWRAVCLPVLAALEKQRVLDVDTAAAETTPLCQTTGIGTVPARALAGKEITRLFLTATSAVHVARRAEISRT